jgi:hypothetical protein
MSRLNNRSIRHKEIHRAKHNFWRIRLLLKRYESTGTRRTLKEFIKAGCEPWCSEIHEFAKPGSLATGLESIYVY